MEVLVGTINRACPEDNQSLLVASLFVLGGVSLYLFTQIVLYLWIMNHNKKMLNLRKKVLEVRWSAFLEQEIFRTKLRIFSHGWVLGNSAIREYKLQLCGCVRCVVGRGWAAPRRGCSRIHQTLGSHHFTSHQYTSPRVPLLCVTGQIFLGCSQLWFSAPFLFSGLT